MDNTGGTWKIVINSPESYMLDLGGWMVVQSYVKYIHKHLVMQNDVKNTSVQYAFNELEQNSLKNIYERWEKVLDLIISGNWLRI